MKIDVEGWEARVLRGAAQALRHTQRMLIEINEPALAKAGSSPGELFGLLRDAGFVGFSTLVNPGLRRLHP